MEVTVDTERLKMVITVEERVQHAVIIDKLTGKTVECTLPELARALEQVAKERKDGTRTR